MEFSSYTSIEDTHSLILPLAPASEFEAYLAQPQPDENEIMAMGAEEGGLEVITIDGMDLSTGATTANRLKITLVGNRPDPVLLTNISARILSRAEPWSGGIVFTSPQGASAAEAIGFDLGGSDLNARHLSDEQPLDEVADAPRYLSDTQVTLGPGERVSFDVMAVASDSSFEWVIDVTTSDGFVLEVTNNGEPWRSSALSSSYGKAWSRNFSASQYYRICVWPDCDAEFPG